MMLSKIKSGGVSPSPIYKNIGLVGLSTPYFPNSPIGQVGQVGLRKRLFLIKSQEDKKCPN